ncbi:hypothetical protein [Bdellovibrio svalbardensis]|uniref:Peptidase C80 domain-containing protein n=1 Tax=Bdellovibrio svalbardensis TaxID=2972972 RepID=A0ABT6DNU5_9BACT|nr:hypothetical protein [Bdellovibrio svalbardensis]MDG0818162.1 hypothetical protein [Bdellovibrio svalbardensis]
MIQRFRIFFSLIITLFACHSLASTDLFVFVSASNSAPEIAALDNILNEQAKESFKKMVAETNAHLPVGQRPVVIDLQLTDLKQMSTGLAEKIKEQRLPADSQVKMLFLIGHGNSKTFWFHNDAGYKGKEIAGILTTAPMHARLAKDFGIYFSACNCGDSLKPTGFQMEFMQEFKDANAKIEAVQQTRSLVSMAHRYMTTAMSFQHLQGRLDTMLYKMGVFSVVENLNVFLFNTLGRAGMTGASFVVASAFAGSLLVLKTFVGPEAVGGAMGFFYDHFWATTGVTLFGHGVLNFWTARWTRFMEYRDGSLTFTSEAIAAGNGILKLIRISAPSCSGVF